jgi:hypothetical protein
MGKDHRPGNPSLPDDKKVSGSSVHKFIDIFVHLGKLYK